MVSQMKKLFSVLIATLIASVALAQTPNFITPSNAPLGSFASVAALTAMYPTPPTGVTAYVTDGTGPVYWNGSAWIQYTTGAGGLPSQAANSVLSNNTGSSAPPTANTTLPSGITIPGTITNDNAAAGIVGEYWDANCALATSGATQGFTLATPTVGTWSSPPWASSTAPYGSYACPFFISANPPTGLSTNTTYWAVPINATTFHVSTTAANAMAGTFAAASGSSSTANLTSSAYQVSSTTVIAVGAMTLTAGDWDCQMSAQFNTGATTSVTNMQAGINSAGTAIGALGSYSDFESAANVMTATNIPILASPMFRESLSAATAEYAVANATYTSTAFGENGDFRCRRVR
jgi:hypothetical protein